MQDLIDNWLPYSFAFLMGLSMLIYSILDGYDLGVGILINKANTREKDLMIASIGPFWDANETWLILGVGLLLVAFPMAHGIILTNLYMPVSFMLFGLIFRGVSFDFRAKVPKEQKDSWNKKFYYGSLLTTVSQGYMLGSYIIGFNNSVYGFIFSCLIAAVLTSSYCLIGACWLIIKCEGDLQKKAVLWARAHFVNSVIGLAVISIATPLGSNRIFDKWFGIPELFWLAPLPLATSALILYLYYLLKRMPLSEDQFNWLPFLITIGIYILSFLGLTYSFYPYIVPDQMTIVEAASSPKALKVILIGVLAVLPILLGYTALSYYIFRGKASELRYD